VFQFIEAFRLGDSHPTGLLAPAEADGIDNHDGLDVLRKLLALTQQTLGVAELPDDLFRLKAALRPDLSPPINASGIILPQTSCQGEAQSDPSGLAHFLSSLRTRKDKCGSTQEQRGRTPRIRRRGEKRDFGKWFAQCGCRGTGTNVVRTGLSGKTCADGGKNFRHVYKELDPHPMHDCMGNQSYCGPQGSRGCVSRSDCDGLCAAPDQPIPDLPSPGPGSPAPSSTVARERMGWTEVTGQAIRQTQIGVSHSGSTRPIPFTLAAR
jgi:hypothetical protein